jgi:hypothetical protein
MGLCHETSRQSDSWYISVLLVAGKILVLILAVDRFAVIEIESRLGGVNVLVALVRRFGLGEFGSNCSQECFALLTVWGEAVVSAGAG